VKCMQVSVIQTWFNRFMLYQSSVAGLNPIPNSNSNPISNPNLITLFLTNPNFYGNHNPLSKSNSVLILITSFSLTLTLPISYLCPIPYQNLRKTLSLTQGMFISTVIRVCVCVCVCVASGGEQYSVKEETWHIPTLYCRQNIWSPCTWLHHAATH
jgi:hypothetical protein